MEEAGRGWRSGKIGGKGHNGGRYRLMVRKDRWRRTLRRQV